MVRKSRDFVNYNERVERDLKILKTGLELSSTETEEADQQTTFSEDLSREELVIKILNTRNEAIDSIKCCESVDIADITQSFLDELLEIDILIPAAANKIHKLAQRVEHIEQILPVSFSLFHETTVSMLMFIPLKLNDLEALCLLYQEKFGNQ